MEYSCEGSARRACKMKGPLQLQGALLNSVDQSNYPPIMLTPVGQDPESFGPKIDQVLVLMKKSPSAPTPPVGSEEPFKIVAPLVPSAPVSPATPWAPFVPLVPSAPAAPVGPTVFRVTAPVMVTATLA
jgi:hypothetical protein